MEENRTSPLKTRLTLFATMLYISAFTFGGGFVIISLLKKKLVDRLHWITEEEMLDYTALAQSCPGAIAVNAAILVGWRTGGLTGMILAVLGTVIPPMAILSVISVCYAAFAGNPWVALALKGMQAGVAAVITDVVITLAGNVLKERSLLRTLLMAAAFIAAFFFRVDVLILLPTAVLLGVVLYLVNWREKPCS